MKLGTFKLGTTLLAESPAAVAMDAMNAFALDLENVMSVPKISKRVLIGTDVVSLATVLADNSIDEAFDRAYVQNVHATDAILYVGAGDSASPPTTDDMGQLPRLNWFPIMGADASDRVFLAASGAATPVVLWLE